MSTDLLEGLDEQQRQAAETLLGPVCILAGAGTGKTRALTHRIAHGVATGVYAPDRVMALTFTTRAAGEMRTRLRSLGAAGVAARTFHAAALAQLGFFWPQLIGGRTPEILPGKGRMLGQAAESLRIRVDTAVLRDLASEIEWRKVRRIGLDEYARIARTRALPNGLDLDQVIELQQRYEDLKDERRQLDFEDVLLVTAGMIDAEPWVADQVREQYRFFVVDEYQDVSPIQHELLELWLGPRTDVCVVGDASQTIYSFAGASSDYLLGFPARHPDARVVRLETNYRSTPGVLQAANRLMRDRPGALELRPARPGKIDPPEVTRWGTDAEEAAGIADAVAERIAAGTRPEQIAVLFRVNAQAAALEVAFAERGIGSRQLGGTRFFDLDAVKRAVLELTSLARTGPELPMYETVADVARGIGWTVDPPAGQGAVRERWEALGALVELADQAADGTTLASFVAELQDRQRAQHEPTVQAVVLATLHSAKGLEWDHVHLMGLSEGLLPISHAKGLEAVDEERRLLYVGLTRARLSLSLSWSAEGLRGRPREPSRFLAELRTGSPGGGRRGSR
ncbi:ATP-dependent helicase [Homoserinibacter sp. GY 40078]|uniref:ATP-dependent helicase n=1 Tax=Homoserinibacter sp. GY 40078 TaxID=2603275 RepID=UPI0011CA8D80|nr:ATP-dependent helicase [Homoserinibacter sp. GY 40078]TXK19626.1 ATP-dependent helicase [Homoserinibacter sp. GY 40078]